MATQKPEAAKTEKKFKPLPKKTITYFEKRLLEERRRVLKELGHYDETFGNTLQEAAASGLPVVAPAVGGPLDLVRDGVTGFLVPPGDPAALASAVTELAASPRLRTAQGAAGRRDVLSRTWPARCEELVGH